MFQHDKTGVTYYTIREKINYYTNILKGKTPATPKLKTKAKRRLPQLQQLNNQSFDSPTMIVTNDKHLGNGINKPRACVVVGTDEKNRLIVCPVHDRTVKTVILDKDITRQVEGKEHKIANSEVYEIKNISGLKSLSKNDIRKLKEIHSKK